MLRVKQLQAAVSGGLHLAMEKLGLSRPKRQLDPGTLSTIGLVAVLVLIPAFAFWGGVDQLRRRNGIKTCKRG
jgi:hypothetical protein